MNAEFSNKVVIVTGGGHGIGKAYVKHFCSLGASVVIAEIDAVAAEHLALELQQGPGKAIAITVDVTDPESVRNMATRTIEAFGRIDVLINNAAIFISVPMSRSPFDEISVDEWDRMMSVNLKGPWLASCAVAPQMRSQGSGKIINISSGTALKGAGNRIHYVTTKAGILGFTKTLANELGEHNICVNCIAPGSTMSEENPDETIVKRRTSATGDRALKRVQTPEDMLGAAEFLASKASDFITGQTLVVDGGSCMH